MEELPTVKDLRRLPWWVLVHYAARCADRVFPLFVKNWPDVERVHETAVRQAIELAYASAEEGSAKSTNAAAQSAAVTEMEDALEFIFFSRAERVTFAASFAFRVAELAADNEACWDDDYADYTDHADRATVLKALAQEAASSAFGAARSFHKQASKAGRGKENSNYARFVSSRLGSVACRF
ncbi:MAG: hypothetical protein ACFCD0_03990 [Gemmataceae bacterium]